MEKVNFPSVFKVEQKLEISLTFEDDKVVELVFIVGNNVLALVTIPIHEATDILE